MVCITVSWNGLSRKARHLRLRPQLTSRSLGCLWSIPEEIWSPAAVWMLPLHCSKHPFVRCWGEQPCNRSFSIIVILITSQTSCATKITAQLSSHGVRLHADAHENNGQRKFQTVPAESEKSAASDADLLPKPTWWHRMQSTRREWLTSLVLFACINWMGKSVTNVYRVVSKCWQTMANIYEYYTMAWLDFFLLVNVRSAHSI